MPQEEQSGFGFNIVCPGWFSSLAGHKDYRIEHSCVIPGMALWGATLDNPRNIPRLSTGDVPESQPALEVQYRNRGL